MKSEYKGKTVCGFIHNHIYEINYQKRKDENTYMVEATYDYTDEKEIKKYMRLTSLKSIEQFFPLIIEISC